MYAIRATASCEYGLFGNARTKLWKLENAVFIEVVSRVARSIPKKSWIMLSAVARFVKPAIYTA